MKKQILSTIVFLGNVFSIHSMMISSQKARLLHLQGAGKYRQLSLQKPTSRVVSRTETSSPFSTGIQKRFYSSSVSSSAPKRTGLWNWIASFFYAKIGS